MCAIDWSLTEMKQFLYAIHQHSEKRIYINRKVNFGCKYSFMSCGTNYRILKSVLIVLLKNQLFCFVAIRGRF